MKLPVIRKIRKEDLGGDIPAWIDRLLSPMNQFIEQVGIAVTGRLSFGENLAGKVIEQSFTHNTALEINTQDSRVVLGVVPIFCDGNIITGYGWNTANNGNLSVTIQFSAGSGTSDCKILVLFS